MSRFVLLSIVFQSSVLTEWFFVVRIPLDQYREVNRRFALEHWYPFGTGGGWKRDDVKGPGVGELGLIIGVFEVIIQLFGVWSIAIKANGHKYET